ncbi:hypothetical protein [Terrihabitans sp. B22-R8]|uniref:hypothetical protein n=1 Tax=Terrihabitans sp. B22-R8 TaxID=3425128 RepID=UPI00403CA1F3
MMNAAQHKPVTEFLEKATALIGEGRYREASEAFVTFEKENPTSDYQVLEAVPFRVQNHIEKSNSATAFTKFTLRNPTWSTEIVAAFREPAKFDDYVKGVEAKVKELTAKAA